MINCKELRIGNWVDSYMGFHSGDAYDKDGKLICSGSFSQPTIRHVQVDIELLKFISENEFATYRPIPLTEDVLDRIDYFYKTDKDGELMYFNGDNIMIRIADMSLHMHSEYDGSTFWVCRLKSLHHLQNICYAIDDFDFKYTP